MPVLGLPFFSRRTGPLRSLLSPPPSLGIEFLGPAISDALSKSEASEVERLGVLREFLQKVERMFQPSLSYLRLTPSITDARPFSWEGYSLNTLYTYVIKIDRSPESLLERFHQSVRKDIRRSEKRIDVHAGGTDVCENLHRFLSMRLRAQGLRFGPPKEYFNLLLKNLGSEVFQPIGAHTSKGMVAAAVVTYHGERAAIWQHASSLEAPKAPLTACLIWHAILSAAERGFREFELVGANTPRLVEYKSKYRPALEPYFETSRGTIAGRSALALHRKLRS